MNEADVLSIMRESVWVMLKIGSPLMIIALIVGLVISLFQALTQIQEMTLVFVPKILAIFLSMLVLMPYMMSTLITFTEHLMDKAVSMGP
jgi:flagellar biosynthetic protein FliQ